MAVKQYKPSPASLRGKVLVSRQEVHRGKPEKTLTKGKSKASARDGAGRISVRRRGGGHKKTYRLIDFKREKRGVAAMVKRIEYDPNRSAFIALLVYEDGDKRYILASEKMKVGDKVVAGDSVRSEEGNALPLAKINLGAFVHNLELKPGRGGQVIRSAGAAGKVLGRDENYVSVELPSGEVRRILGTCYATVGVLSNKDNKNENSAKAGRSRWQGRRPKVRGVVMNPVDHPMGGGEGKTAGGRHPVSPTGVLAKGYRTRKNKTSDRFIVRRRKTKKR